MCFSLSISALGSNFKFSKYFSRSISSCSDFANYALFSSPLTYASSNYLSNTVSINYSGFLFVSSWSRITLNSLAPDLTLLSLESDVDRKNLSSVPSSLYFSAVFHLFLSVFIIFNFFIFI